MNLRSCLNAVTYNLHLDMEMYHYGVFEVLIGTMELGPLSGQLGRH